ncbi:DUF58 domain-containing protein [uncultured Nevskia sp.]|uniref:DUF58 domain-containing protein n=1 Tax=uncultured Nevskia sp. TaxID=228950 RepID=UPI0025D50E63|nr:DUF58 domain-containing protein [uncultured Nevskia sp.]
MSSLIPPDVRARLKSLRISSRLTPNGQGLGLHTGRGRGAGLEFAQYRAYGQGDEPRQIDWKLFARSDRYFVRDATRDSPLSVWLVIDTSASMAQADPERPDHARIDAARIIAACIAERAVQQGDSVGLITVGGRSTQGLPAAPGVRHRDRLLLLLAGLVADGRDGARAAPPLLSAQIAPDALVIVISDGFDDSLAESCERLAAARRDVRAIRILTVGEAAFAFQGSQRFIDPESGRERTLDADAARSGFLERFGVARREQLRRLARHGVTCVEHSLDEPADTPLHQLFAARGRSA